MARKVFISFLGTTDYKEVNYIYEDKGLETPFAPIASLKILASDFSEKDVILFFVTKKAKKANGEQLIKECVKNGLRKPILVDIENENSQENIWKNFTTIYKKLQKNDEIIFDITFGFRAVPMLFMVLANYAKFLLDIKISKILYGAYEAKDEKKNVPIWDLTNFALLQKWSESANNFINSGNSTELSKLILENKEGNKTYFEEFAERLNDFTLSFNTCRGKNIFKSDILNDLILKSKEIQPDLFPPLIPILNELEEQISQFNLSENVLNGFKAVKWCVNNNLTQQGITLLLETLKAFIAEENNLDYQIYDHMEIVAAAFYHNLKPWAKVKPNLKSYEAKIFKIKDSRNVNLLAGIYEELRRLRNDINHAGLSLNAENGRTFKNALLSYYDEINKKLNLK